MLNPHFKNTLFFGSVSPLWYFWQGNHQIYGRIRCIYTVLANRTHVQKSQDRSFALQFIMKYRRDKGSIVSKWLLIWVPCNVQYERIRKFRASHCRVGFKSLPKCTSCYSPGALCRLQWGNPNNCKSPHGWRLQQRAGHGSWLKSSQKIVNRELTGLALQCPTIRK